MTILPCPFCGSTNVRCVPGICVTCDDCDADGSYKVSAAEAIDAWNNVSRPSPSAALQLARDHLDPDAPAEVYAIVNAALTTPSSLALGYAAFDPTHHDGGC